MAGMTNRAANYVIQDEKMRELLQLTAQIAPTTLPVLILGESGSGKGVIPDYLHQASTRSHRPLIKVNCAGLAEGVVESELFGYERGSFGGAVQSCAGLFEQADGGSLFLDEVAELPLRTQAKLLRVIESGEYVRVGGNRMRKANCRFISATHRDIAHMMRCGEFRSDLFFRLRGATVHVPPLRERPDDILPLARHFVCDCARGWQRPVPVLTPEAQRALLDYRWPGNVRELRHAMELSVAMSTQCITAERAMAFIETGLHLRSVPQPPAAPPPSAGLPAPMDTPPAHGMRDAMREFERRRISAALEATQGNQTAAAKLLGISRRTLCTKLTLHGFSRPRRAARGECA